MVNESQFQLKDVRYSTLEELIPLYMMKHFKMTKSIKSIDTLRPPVLEAEASWDHKGSAVQYKMEEEEEEKRKM
jgi:hypothetical protein